jgi:RNA polymerase sigma factor (sigma-70 family)
MHDQQDGECGGRARRGAAAGGEGAGAEAALGEVVAAMRGRLRALFRHAGVGLADAEDILQDSLLIVLGHWREIRDPERYLWGTVRQQIQQLRRRHALFVLLSLDEEAIARLAPVDSPHEASDLRLDVETLLGRLTARSRQVVELRYGEQLSAREVAALLGGSEAGIRQTASRAIARLRRYARALRLDG